MRDRDPYLLAVACGAAVGFVIGSWIVGGAAFWGLLWGLERIRRQPRTA
jgi:hypothetical protein